MATATPGSASCTRRAAPRWIRNWLAAAAARSCGRATWRWCWPTTAPPSATSWPARTRPPERSSAVRVAPERHQGDHDVLLVLQMPQQRRSGAVQGLDQAVDPVGSARRARGDRAVQGQARLVQGLQMRVDGVVVPVQQVQPGLDARLQRAERREIVSGLDPVMAVQVLEEGLQG